ncbi:MAG: radical SAM protein [Promethearchaeota archaeon]
MSTNESNDSKIKEFATMVRQAGKFIGFVLKNSLLGIPMAVNFDITYKCNLRCEHCYYWRSINALGIKSWELSDEQWLRVFKYYSSIGVNNVSLTGGEPSLRLNVIKAAHDYFPQVQTATNGMVRIPSDIQTRGIWLSIDGPEEVHNKIRGSRNCFQQLKENYQDDKRVAVSSTISTSNYKYIDDIVKVCLDLNVKGVFFMFYSGNKDDSLYLTGRKYKIALNGVLKAVRDYPDFVLITEEMIQAYHSKAFINECPFLGRTPAVASFYADLTRKRCVMGDNVDCKTCSCIVPVGAYVLKHHLIEFDNWRKIQKILF